MADITSVDDFRRRLNRLEAEKHETGEAETLNRLMGLFKHVESFIDTEDGPIVTEEWGRGCVLMLTSDGIADDKDVLTRCLEKYRERFLICIPFVVVVDCEVRREYFRLLGSAGHKANVLEAFLVDCLHQRAMVRSPAPSDARKDLPTATMNKAQTKSLSSATKQARLALNACSNG